MLRILSKINIFRILKYLQLIKIVQFVIFRIKVPKSISRQINLICNYSNLFLLDVKNNNSNLSMKILCVLTVKVIFIELEANLLLRNNVWIVKKNVIQWLNVIAVFLYVVIVMPNIIGKIKYVSSFIL
jgi:hypothetical protein